MTPRKASARSLALLLPLFQALLATGLAARSEAGEPGPVGGDAPGWERVESEPDWAVLPPARSGFHRFVLVFRSNLEALAVQRSELLARDRALQAFRSLMQGLAAAKAVEDAAEASACNMKILRRSLRVEGPKGPAGRKPAPGNTLSTAWVLYEVSEEDLVATLPEESRPAVRSKLEAVRRSVAASLAGSRVTVKPWGYSFDLPDSWMQWYERFENNLCLKPGELEAARDGAGEWDTEFAKVVNAALPFSQCVIHAGGEGWGSKAVAFSDLQARLYALEEKPDLLAAGLEARALEAVKSLTGKAPVLAERGETYGWVKLVVAFDLWYGDYGGRAFVDFRYRRFGDRTAVFAFMFTNYQSQEEEIHRLLDSSRFQGEEGRGK